MHKALWIATGLNAELTGIERLVVDSVRGVAAAGGVDQTVVVHGDEEWAGLLAAAGATIEVRPRRPAEIARVPAGSGALGRFDSVHSYSAPPPLNGGRTSYTVHDWGPVVDRQLSGKTRALWSTAILRGMRRSDEVHFLSTAVSTATPRWLRPALSGKPTFCGRGARPVSLGAVEAVAERDLVLFVGSDVPRKRLEALCAAVTSCPELRLVCAGSGTGQRTAPRIEGLGRVSDAELAVLYRRAQVFALVSSYEGLGLPVLEAWEAGCEIVLSEAVAHQLPAELVTASHVVTDPANIDALGGALRAAAAKARPVGRAAFDDGVVVDRLLQRAGRTLTGTVTRDLSET